MGQDRVRALTRVLSQQYLSLLHCVSGEQQPAHSCFLTTEERGGRPCLMPIPHQKPGAHSSPAPPWPSGAMCSFSAWRVRGVEGKERDIQPLGTARLNDILSLPGLWLNAECFEDIRHQADSCTAERQPRFQAEVWSFGLEDCFSCPPSEPPLSMNYFHLLLLLLYCY